MVKVCGKAKFSQNAFNHLHDLGIDIDAQRQPLVFDGGFVGRDDGQKGEVKYATQSHSGNRSQSGSRKGQRARSRGTQASGHPFRSDALEAAYGSEFRLLAQHYDALGFEDRHGLWAVASSSPLGPDGPEVHLLIAVPLDQRLAPRAWAFEKIGPLAKLMSLKHTNFLDASICAFPHGHLPWPSSSGLLGLMDIYVLWVVRKLHRDEFGWWPGPQVGACPYYRLREFDPREDCGCGSGKRYGSCHMAADLLSNPENALAEFRSLFRCDFDDRQPPKEVMEAARSRWASIPSMGRVFAHRPDPSGVLMI